MSGVLCALSSLSVPLDFSSSEAASYIEFCSDFSAEGCPVIHQPSNLCLRRVISGAGRRVRGQEVLNKTAISSRVSSV